MQHLLTPVDGLLMSGRQAKVSTPPPELSVRLFQKSSITVGLMEVGEVYRSQEAGETSTL